MPQDAQTNLQTCLSSLEELQNGVDDADYSTTNRTHLNLLKSLNTVLENYKVTSSVAKRVLKICLRYNTDVRCVPYLFSIISTLINVDKDKPLVDFLPFALAILEFINTKCVEENTSNLHILSIQVLMSHPRNTLVTLVRDYSPKLIETFELSLKHTNLDLKMESFTILRMLEWLPAQEKTLFVKTGTSLWMLHVVPAMIIFLMKGEDENKIGACLTYIEMLSNELVCQDYFDHPDWPTLIECVADKKKFPSCIQTLMEKSKPTWHRIWIVLIKILKSHVTRIFSPYGSPINSMLPIVESAFKKEPIQRVRAFTCWNELIESFSHETGNCVAKRVKLIIIPLKLYNAKTEDTVEAKFDTWWFFLQKFRPKIQEFKNEILILFLQFMFGKKQTGKQLFQTYQISDSLRVKCLEAFSEVMGHNYCAQCPIKKLTPLDGEVTTFNLLMQNWKEYTSALKSAVAAAAMTYTEDTKQIIRCIWKSIVLKLADLTENTVRQDMFDDIISIFPNLLSDPKLSGNDNLMEIIVDDLTLPLMLDKQLTTLILSKRQRCCPLHKILVLIVDDKFSRFFKRYNSKEFMNHLIVILFEQMVSTPQNCVCMLDDLPVTDIALTIWTNLVNLSIDSDMCVTALNSLLRWPFKIVHINLEIKEAALAWYTLYNIVHAQLEKIDFNNEISKVLTRPVEDSEATNYFVLFALIGVLRHKPDEAKMAKLEALSYEMNEYKDYEQLMPTLIDTLVFLLHDSTINADENLSQITINCVENIMKVLKTISACETPASNNNKVKILVDTNVMLSDTLNTSLKTYLSECKNESIKKQIRSVLALHNNTECAKNISENLENTENTKNMPPKEFASPKMQEPKKNKKKEASIVNTVVENGEEYVVVKSNWKFNPKNLTENQKEKLQRKRDIPALYQDLSQSQDEFKLTAWKTDSQDTSLSSSKSASNDVLETLKQMTNADIVPKIMENIIDTNRNNKTIVNVSPITKVTTSNSDKSSPGTKSPRMALKDRVFRNVRNLIEKSSPALQSKTADKQDDNHVLENVSKSPISQPTRTVTPSIVDTLNTDDATVSENNYMKSLASSLEVKTNKVLVVTAKKIDLNITVVSSPVPPAVQPGGAAPLAAVQSGGAAPLTAAQAADRPSRMKRTPRKFDDSLLLGMKKKKCKNNSMSDSKDSQEYNTKITQAQVHANDIDMNSPQMDNTKKNEADLNDSNINATDSDDNVIVLDNDIVTTSVSSKDIDHNDALQADVNPVSPATPIDKPKEKSPEKPTTGEIPNSKSKASERNDTASNLFDNMAQNEMIVNTPSKNKKAAQKPSCKNSNDENSDANLDTPAIPLRKLRKSRVQNDELNDTNDENTTVSTPITEKESIQPKQSARKRVLQNDNNKKNEKLNIVFTPDNKKEKDTNEAMSTKKCSLLKEADEQPVNIITPIIANDVNQIKTNNKQQDIEVENDKNEKNLMVTPKSKVKESIVKSSTKKKKSRIESELMIDMVEGHPFLKSQSEKRLTRKKQIEVESSGRRKTLAGKFNKTKLELTPKTTKKPKEKKTSPSVNCIIVEDSQDKAQNISAEILKDDPPCSEDVIESSQDSTMTTISVKSTKTKRLPIVSLEKIPLSTLPLNHLRNNENPDNYILESTDIELPQNNTVEADKNTMDLTENMDTEPFVDTKNTTDLTENLDTEPMTCNESDDVIILSDSGPTPLTVNSQTDSMIGAETQELAEADTQPNDPKEFQQFDVEMGSLSETIKPSKTSELDATEDDDITQSLPEAALILANMSTADVSTSFNADNQRKQDFLNNTVEISPIKVQSPVSENKSPSPETSNDYVVIKLTSPVHSNGEPFEKPSSPEFFSEDKLSPEKRNASPPRVEVVVNSSSPSSSLSLKKNRPQVNRPSGRAAHMLGLLSVNPDLKITRMPEPEEAKKHTSTPVRRNLRILYSSVGESDDNADAQNVEDEGNFLKLKRTLPTVTSSPSGPILKRKLADIIDETTTSPANKRKRVSFHDPPVSTTMSVLKYIEPISLARSPQNSTKKRLERPPRSGVRSPKRLDSAFLDSALSKTVESFTETPLPSIDTENISLDVTPAVEIVKTSELNDTDPICPDLVDCKDHIDVIATELSSPAMRDLFIKELEGKVETVGDLARMTELEVNRLCIKAPKITVAKKVLTDYIANRPQEIEIFVEEVFSEPVTESLIEKCKDVEMQTDEVKVCSVAMQTNALVHSMQTQTDIVTTAELAVQTDESGSKTTADIIDVCMTKRDDFIEELKHKLNEDDSKIIAGKLSTKTLFELIKKKCDSPNLLLDRLLKQHCKGVPKDAKSNIEQTFLMDYLCDRYESKDLILLCSKILQKVHDKPL